MLDFTSIPRNAVFVLLGGHGDGKLTTIGTVVAVSCPNRDLVLTAGHCVLNEDGSSTTMSYYCISRVKLEEGGKIVLDKSTVIPLSIVCAKSNPDFAVLRRRSGTFGATIPLCPCKELPWVIDEDRYCARVGVLHCPSTIFLDDFNYDELKCEFVDASVSIILDHHIKVNVGLCEGSSGGAVIIHNGCLVGILTNSYELTRRALEKHNDPNAAMELVPLAEVKSGGVEIQSFTSTHVNSVNQSFAIRVDTIYLRESVSKKLISLSDWLALGC